MRCNGFPAGPLILGLILGGLKERSMRQALLISSGDFSTFVTKPISASLLALAALSLLGPVLTHLRRRRVAARTAPSGGTVSGTVAGGSAALAPGGDEDAAAAGPGGPGASGASGEEVAAADSGRRQATSGAGVPEHGVARPEDVAPDGGDGRGGGEGP